MIRKNTRSKPHGAIRREYSYLGCPLTHNRSPWCHRLCAPNVSGKGRCGRIAPHSLKSQIQAAIEAHKMKAAE